MVRLWDVASRQPLGEPLQGHVEAVLSVKFSPDGKLLASADMGGTIWIWDVDPLAWAARLCNLVNRNFSLIEWQHYMGRNAPYRRTCRDFPAGKGVRLN
jgi:WD40 repeat protein